MPATTYYAQNTNWHGSLCPDLTGLFSGQSVSPPPGAIDLGGGALEDPTLLTWSFFGLDLSNNPVWSAASADGSSTYYLYLNDGTWFISLINGDGSHGDCFTLAEGSWICSGAWVGSFSLTLPSAVSTCWNTAQGGGGTWAPFPLDTSGADTLNCVGRNMDVGRDFSGPAAIIDSVGGATLNLSLAETIGVNNPNTDYGLVPLYLCATGNTITGQNLHVMDDYGGNIFTGTGFVSEVGIGSPLANAYHSDAPRWAIRSSVNQIFADMAACIDWTSVASIQFDGTRWFGNADLLPQVSADAIIGQRSVSASDGSIIPGTDAGYAAGVTAGEASQSATDQDAVRAKKQFIIKPNTILGVEGDYIAPPTPFLQIKP
jgi:hypothetical protein